MSNSARQSKLILITISLTFVLINLGGHVHNTGSSLACPDWPLCFGQIMPQMTGGVLIEHSHRLLASLVGGCTVLIFFLTRKKSYGGAAWLALALVILQGLLGGMTVIYKLPPLVSTAHLGVAMLFFCCLIFLYQKNQGKYFFITPALTSMTALLYLQILLGALLRHLGAGSACGLGAENIFLCHGNWWPQNVNEALQLLHRFLAISIGFILVLKGIHLIKQDRFITGLFLAGLIVLQIWLGTEIINTGFRPLVTMLHLGGATLLLGVLWKEHFTSRQK